MTKAQFLCGLSNGVLVYSADAIAERSLTSSTGHPN
jgi:hypothetical protein